MYYIESHKAVIPEHILLSVRKLWYQNIFYSVGKLWHQNVMSTM